MIRMALETIRVNIQLEYYVSIYKTWLRPNDSIWKDPDMGDIMYVTEML